MFYYSLLDLNVQLLILNESKHFNIIEDVQVTSQSPTLCKKSTNHHVLLNTPGDVLYLQLTTGVYWTTVFRGWLLVI